MAADFDNLPTNEMLSNIKLSKVELTEDSVIVVSIPSGFFPHEQMLNIHNAFKNQFPNNTVFLKFDEVNVAFDTKDEYQKIVRASWLEDSAHIMRCSNCRHIFDKRSTECWSYCPHCGAKIDQSVHYTNCFGCSWCDGVGVAPDGTFCGECTNIDKEYCAVRTDK